MKLMNNIDSIANIAEIIEKNDIDINQCFFLNINKSFDTLQALRAVKAIPLNRLFFFTGFCTQKKLINKLFFLPCWLQHYSDCEKEEKFYLKNNSTLLLRDREKISSIRNIKTKPFSQFLNELKRWNILKNFYVFIDSCGLSYQILKGFENYINNIVLLEIYTEVYEKWIGQTTQDTVFDYLYKKGLKSIYIKPINHFQNKSIWIKN